MSETVRLYANKTAVVSSYTPDTHLTAGASIDFHYPTNRFNRMLLAFDALPEDYYYKIPNTPKLWVYCFDSDNGTNGIDLRIGKLTFDPATVTYNDAAGLLNQSSIDGFGDFYPTPGYVGAPMSGGWATVIDPDLAVGIDVKDVCQLYTSTGTYKPYIEVVFSDTNVTPTVKSASPQSGFVPKYAANTFSWVVGKSAACYGSISQVSAVFRWRTDENAMATEIELDTQQSYTVPANTFTTDLVQWQVEITANTGDAVTSPWYTLSTVEAASTAVALSPVSSVLDGGSSATFKWQHVIATGTAQTAFDLQVSTDGVSFTTIKSENSAAQETTVEAGTFSAGELYWRVRTYNTDGVAGAWSEAVSVIVIAAPTVPPVSVLSNTPRPVITWQSDEQQAFEAQVGAWDSGIVFGTAKSIKAGMFLEDGEHTARVRVQNKYGLWSNWGTVLFTVENTQGEEIVLSVTGTYQAELSWDTSGTYDIYYIYRDGLLIGKTARGSYQDNFSIGTVSYTVRGVKADDHYTISNEAVITIEPDTVMLLDIKTGEWMALTYAETSDRAIQSSLSWQASFTHIAGSKYPLAEISEFADTSMMLACAFMKTDVAMHFEKLLGQAVVVKGRRSDMISGIVTDIQKYTRRFYTAYNATITETDCTEEVSYD